MGLDIFCHGILSRSVGARMDQIQPNPEHFVPRVQDSS